MKLIDKLTKKFANKASVAVKSEIKKTAVDLLPTILAIGSAIVGIIIFKGVVQNDSHGPDLVKTNVTTNNYFFNELSEETILKIIEEDY